MTSAQKDGSYQSDKFATLFSCTHTHTHTLTLLWQLLLWWQYFSREGMGVVGRRSSTLHVDVVYTVPILAMLYNNTMQDNSLSSRMKNWIKLEKGEWVQLIINSGLAKIIIRERHLKFIIHAIPHKQTHTHTCTYMYTYIVNHVPNKNTYTWYTCSKSHSVERTLKLNSQVLQIPSVVLHGATTHTLVNTYTYMLLYLVIRALKYGILSM